MPTDSSTVQVGACSEVQAFGVFVRGVLAPRDSGLSEELRVQLEGSVAVRRMLAQPGVR